MNKKYFYSLIRNGKFLNKKENENDTDNIQDAIMFNSEKEVLDYWDKPSTKIIREENDISIVEVECILREYN